jgi:transcriptional regulator with XRE-family HTH domain
MENIMGEKLRRFRQRKGLTLREIALRSGLSEGFVSQVERGLSSPSIISLKKLCEALCITLNELFEDHNHPFNEDAPNYAVTKARDQMYVHIPSSPIVYRLLSAPLRNGTIEVLINEYPLNYKQSLTQHRREEFGYVLEGQLTLRIEQEIFSLCPGDSYQLLSMSPHSYETSEKEGAKVMVVSTHKVLLPVRRSF